MGTGIAANNLSSKADDVVGRQALDYESLELQIIESPGMQAELGRATHQLFLSPKDIDWPRTKAYCQTEPGLIRINLQGREPRGVVSPQAYHALRSEIVQKLRCMEDPSTARTIQATVVVREEAYHGRYLDKMPDIVYMPFDAGYRTLNPVMFISSKIVLGGFGPTGTTGWTGSSWPGASL
jgi:hypothetical protein